MPANILQGRSDIVYSFVIPIGEKSLPEAKAAVRAADVIDQEQRRVPLFVLQTLYHRVIRFP